MVGVTIRVVETTQYKETRDAISHDWLRFLNDQDLTPILIPNQLKSVTTFLQQLEISAILLTNGNNVGAIDSLESGQKFDDVAVERDETEREVIDFAVKNKIPLLGVCRGMQLLNVYFGGTLIRDLSKFCFASCSHVNQPHEVELLDSVFGETFSRPFVQVNSYHRQGVSLNSLSVQFKTFALAEGNIVEGFIHQDLPIIGIQWHPERDNPAKELDKVILQKWLHGAEILCI